MVVMVSLWQKLIKSIQVNFVLIPSEAGMRPELLLKYSSHFLAATWISQLFTLAIL